MPASSRRYRTPRSRRSVGQSLTSGQRWFAAFVAILATISTVSVPVVGSVFVENRLAGDTETLGQGLVLLDYDSGTHLTIDSQADWDSGTYLTSQADAESSGSLTLEHYGAIPPTASAAWWNTAWTVRRCITITNPGPSPLSEHPVEFVIDTTSTVTDGEMLPGGADVRAVDSATGLELPLWIEGDNVPSPASEIWVQLASAPTGNSEVCLYSGNPAATTSVSDEQAVFTYSTPKINYYTLSAAWAGATASIVSYVDGNSISVGATTQSADRGDVVTFAVNRNSIIQATGPISGASTSNPTDSIVPESLAATSYVFAINRNIQTIWVRALDGPVTLEFQAGGAVINTTVVGSPAAPAATQTITPAMQAVGIVADATGGEGVLVRSTGGGQFLAVHEGDRTVGQSTDAVVGVPWLGEAIYGVRSRYLQVVAGATGTTYSAIGSDGTNIVNQAVGPTAMDTTNRVPVSPDRRGQGPAMRLTSAGPIVGATQFADENGSEITNFIPFSLLEHEYFLPLRANYAAIACPVPGQQITMTPPAGASSVLTCTNPGGLAGSPGKAYVGIGAIPAGTLFESNDRFFLYVEKTGTNDEINLFAGKAARPRPSTNPSHAIGQLEGLFKPSGTWSGPATDSGTSGVYGLLEMLGSLPAGTSVSLQLATGSTAAAALSATPVGPDGTAASSYGMGASAIAAIHDFDQFVRIVVTLETTDPLETPTITSVDVSADLAELTTSDIALTEFNITASPGVSSHLLTRIHSTGTLSYSAQLTYRDGTNLPAANLVTVRTDLPADHVRAVAGAIVQGQGPAFALTPATTFSLYVDEDITAGETVIVDVRLSAEEANGVILEHDLRFILTAP